MPLSNGLASHDTFERGRGVYQIEILENLSHAVVHLLPGDGEDSGRGLLFHLLSEASIPVFLIKLHVDSVTFALETPAVGAMLAALQTHGLIPAVRHHLALVTVMATSMRDLTGVMVDIADALSDASARLFGVGDSHNTVQCLIDGSRVEAAVKSLRQKFQLDTRHA